MFDNAKYYVSMTMVNEFIKRAPSSSMNKMDDDVHTVLAIS